MLYIIFSRPCVSATKEWSGGRPVMRERILRIQASLTAHWHDKGADWRGLAHTPAHLRERKNLGRLGTGLARTGTNTGGRPEAAGTCREDGRGLGSLGRWRPGGGQGAPERPPAPPAPGSARASARAPEASAPQRPAGARSARAENRKKEAYPQSDKEMRDAERRSGPYPHLAPYPYGGSCACRVRPSTRAGRSCLWKAPRGTKWRKWSNQGFVTRDSRAVPQ